MKKTKFKMRMKDDEIRNSLKIQWERIVSIFLTLNLIFALCPISPVANDVKAEEPTLQNPQCIEDSSMRDGQKVTYDCIWFVSYPQAEVIKTSMTEPIGETLKNGKDFIKDDSLYEKLQTADEWDENGDLILDGAKYRRVQKSDALYSADYEAYYKWDDSGYHYFKYQPIKWRVLEVSDGDAFLFSDMVLDNKPYNKEMGTVTWETSSMRSWLNGYESEQKSFIDMAFTDAQQQVIKTSNIKNADNLTCKTEGGEDTKDKIFLLSESEVYTDDAIKYGFSSSNSTRGESRRKKSSTYAKAMGINSDYDADENAGNCWWWLRSMGSMDWTTAIVNMDGYVYFYGCAAMDCTFGCSPALHLSLSNASNYSYAGTVCTDGSENEISVEEIIDDPTTEEATTTEETTTTEAVTTTEAATTTEETTTTEAATTTEPTTTQKKPTTEEPTTTQKKPTTEEPTTTQKKPTTEEPTTTQKKPTTEEPTTTQKKPTTEEPTTTQKKPTTEEPTTTQKKPTTEEPTTAQKQPTTEETTTEEPTTTQKQPTTEEPTTEEATTEELTTTQKQPSTEQPVTTQANSTTTANYNPSTENQTSGMNTQNQTATITKPLAVKQLKVKKLLLGRVKLSWKKKDRKDITYQVIYADNKKFKHAKKKYTKKGSITLKGMKKKTYYFKVRAYCKVNGKKVYGAWSKKVKKTLK